MAPSSTSLASIRLSMAVLLTVWIGVWILKPTKFWKRSWHGAEEWASKSFLGESGLIVVVFCLPILAVATLGYIYLYRCNNEERIRPSKNYARLVTIISNPIAVDTPIGIVSGSEFFVASLFITFLAWTYYSNIASDFKKLAPYKSLLLDRWHLKVMHMGVRLGSLSEVCLAILLLPVLRGMSLFRILGVQFEASVAYHVWIANAMILFSVLHGSVIMFVWGVKSSLWIEITKWQSIGRVNLAGAISLAVGVVIWITSLPLIRRKHFELFFSAHHLYILFILFFLLHAGDSHFYLVFPGVLLFALDKVLRITQSGCATHVISAQVLKCKAVELTLPKHPSMKYSPTSTIFLNIPSISRFQWHPFSITSSGDTNQDRFSVLIKCQGKWTDAVYDMIHSMVGAGSNKLKSLAVRMEGPYGPANFPYNWYDTLILVAGGSGITPMLSIIQSIDSRNAKINTCPTKIHLVYMVKKSQDLSMLSPITPLLLTHPDELGYLKMKIFVTREDGSTSTAREIWRGISETKTVIMDPILSAGGLPTPQNLQWIAIVTGMSFLLFLTSVVCLSHVFVHREMKPHENKSPSWVGDLIILCSFFITASSAAVVAVLLRQRKWVKEFCGLTQNQAKGRDLHSVDEQGVMKDVEINFGTRPNLIDILSELASEIVEPRVGVLVCGPDSMQRSVATFCKTYCLKDNGNRKSVFTFQSINFFL